MTAPNLRESPKLTLDQERLFESISSGSSLVSARHGSTAERKIIEGLLNEVFEKLGRRDRFKGDGSFSSLSGDALAALKEFQQRHSFDYKSGELRKVQANEEAYGGLVPDGIVGMRTLRAALMLVQRHSAGEKFTAFKTRTGGLWDIRQVPPEEQYLIRDGFTYENPLSVAESRAELQRIAQTYGIGRDAAHGARLIGLLLNSESGLDSLDSQSITTSARARNFGSRAAGLSQIIPSTRQEIVRYLTRTGKSFSGPFREFESYVSMIHSQRGGLPLGITEPGQLYALNLAPSRMDEWLRTGIVYRKGEVGFEGNRALAEGEAITVESLNRWMNRKERFAARLMAQLPGDIRG